MTTTDILKLQGKDLRYAVWAALGLRWWLYNWNTPHVYHCRYMARQPYDAADKPWEPGMDYRHTSGEPERIEEEWQHAGPLLDKMHREHGEETVARALLPALGIHAGTQADPQVVVASVVRKLSPTAICHSFLILHHQQ